MTNRSARIRFATTIALMIPLVALSVCAADEPSPSPEQSLRWLKEGNERFAADRLENKDVGAARRKELTAGQHPFAVVLSCADSRVPPEIVFNRGLGDIFVVRVAGNISEPFALGSVDYAVEHLHIPLIVVLGHGRCGAVATALGKSKPAGNLGRVIGEIDVGEHLSADKDEALAGAVENNARRQAELLCERSDVIRENVKQKRLQIAAGVYDLATGKVKWLEVK